jgi:protein SCO1/2
LIAGLAVVVVVAVAVAAWVLTPGPQGERSGSGTAAIGGPFELVNTQGETVTRADFAGRYRLVYFGFTYCPDVCPSSLMDMTRALDRLAERAPAKAERVVPIFITIDPQRDTVEVMRNYVENFHPRLVGLTGSEQQVKAAADAYRVYYEKVSPQQYYDSDAAAESSDADYLMAHSSYMLLMGPGGEYMTNFKYTATPADIADGLMKHISGS